MANRDAYNSYRAQAMKENPYIVYRMEADGTWYHLTNTNDWKKYIENYKKTFGDDLIFMVKDRSKRYKIIYEEGK